MGNISKLTVRTLAGCSVLVVEDEFLLLSEMEAVLADAGVDTVYGCRSIAEALGALDVSEITVAVLDVRIGRDSIAPVARKLAERGTPFLFYTGQIGGDRLVAEWPDRPILSKPSPPHRIISAIASLAKSEPVLPRRTA